MNTKLNKLEQEALKMKYRVPKYTSGTSLSQAFIPDTRITKSDVVAFAGISLFIMALLVIGKTFIW